jgi:hypothetical protein
VDGCAVAALIPSWDQVKAALSVTSAILSVIGSIVIAASLATSWTSTPAPGTRRARLYRCLELAALLFGRAKDTGALPATPQVDSVLREAIDLFKPKPEGSR